MNIETPQLYGWQTITSDGSKKFEFRTRKMEHGFPIIDRSCQISDCMVICIAEGIANTYSMYMTLQIHDILRKCCCIAAFDVGNVQSVYNVVRNKYPDANIVLVADNDINDSGANIGVETCQKIVTENPHDKKLAIFIPNLSQEGNSYVK